MVERQVAAMEGILPPEAAKLLASWSVWSATGTLMIAVSICYGDEDKRSFVRFNLEALALSTGLAFRCRCARSGSGVARPLGPSPSAEDMACPDLARSLAGSGGAGNRWVGNRLPIRASPGAPEVGMGQLGGDNRYGIMARRFDRLHLLRLQRRKLRQDIWIARCGDRATAVLHNRLRHPAWGGIECGEGTSSARGHDNA